MSDLRFALTFVLAGLLAGMAAAQRLPEKKNMELVGYSDLQGRHYFNADSLLARFAIDDIRFPFVRVAVAHESSLNF